MENKELLLKLKALADRGVEGEKVNAEALLQKLLKKHGIKLEDLDEVVMKQRQFRFTNEWEDKLLHQMFYAKYPERILKVYTNKRTKINRETVLIEMSDAEFIEFEYTYEVYKNDLHKQMEMFYSAFLTKNHIFPENPPEDSGATDVSDKYTSEELMQMALMAEGVSRSRVNKALGE